ncbi:MAG: CPBP family intramembrane metalloprotease [Planctomycetes bacterium]|nr:CPBP family intramembrane metalloprotease [Planctomycetota bacterium]
MKISQAQKRFLLAAIFGIVLAAIGGISYVAFPPEPSAVVPEQKLIELSDGTVVLERRTLTEPEWGSLPAHAMRNLVLSGIGVVLLGSLAFVSKRTDVAARTWIGAGFFVGLLAFFFDNFFAAGLHEWFGTGLFGLEAEYDLRRSTILVVLSGLGKVAGAVFGAVMLGIIFHLRDTSTSLSAGHFEARPGGAFRESLRSLGFSVLPSAKDLAICVLASFGVILAASTLLAFPWAIALHGIGIEFTSHTTFYHLIAEQSRLGIVLIYLSICVFVPIGEETVFRGLIHGGFASSGALRPFSAIMASSFIFAMAHFPVPYSLLPVFFVGAVLAFLFSRTKSIYPSIVVHGLFNAANLTMVLYDFDITIG